MSATRRFALATLLPLLPLGAGAFLGGAFIVAAAGYFLVAVTLADRLLPEAPAAEGADAEGEGDRLLALIGCAHLGLLALTLAAAAGATGLGPAGRAGMVLAAGLWMGQVAHPAAHELIHRRRRWLFLLGAAVYTSLLYGHHVSAHRLVHHPHVGSDDDPATAVAGEGFYAFALRAWTGAFAAGHAAEAARAARRGRRGPGPYGAYTAGAAAFLLAAWLAFGPGGLFGHLILAALVQTQILLGDYVQHYGLVRARRPGGGLEPVGPAHSWDAPAPFSGAVMLNAPRHADHHAHPARPFGQLAAGAAPRLPHSLPVMAAVALVPPLWRRVMRAPLATLARARRAPPGPPAAG
ncbi:MAG: fatty acid desaturase [Rhodobacteraceae bacterium]|nr:fatty acid desaturase [Paracoccaceae bacterium]